MIPQQIESLIEAHRKVCEKYDYIKSLRPITVSKMATLAGSTYETIRNSVELEHEHLLRRRAIRRISMRMKVLKGGKTVNQAEDLLKEIVWGKYTSKINVPEMMVEEVGKIIQKYQLLVAKYHNKFQQKISSKRAEDLYDIMSFEIERAIVPYFDKDALINIQFFNLTPLKIAKSANLNEKQENIQTYINVIKSVNKFDRAMIKYYMFTNAFNNWIQATPDYIDSILHRLNNTLDDIETHMSYAISNRKFKEFIRQSIPLKVLNKTIEDNLNTAEKILDDKGERDEHIKATCNLEYSQLGRKITKLIIKTVIYLAMTKMVLAFLVEVPYEIYVNGSVDYLPLGINILFPPILMALIAGSFRIPKMRNTTAIIEMIDRLMDPTRTRFVHDGLARDRDKPFMYFIFRIFSYLIFFAVVGGIAYLLKKYLGFTSVSIGIFVLFLSLISFGALRVRNLAMEIVVVPMKGNIFTPLIDMIATPVLVVGKKLTESVASLSPIPLFLDYIVESPFKSIVRVFEEWNTYVKEQKEEIV